MQIVHEFVNVLHYDSYDYLQNVTNIMQFMHRFASNCALGRIWTLRVWISVVTLDRHSMALAQGTRTVSGPATFRT